MAEEKRPVLSLKRKPAENSTAPAEATPAPGVVRPKEGRGGLVPAGLEGKESET
ncbi:conjugal transfer fertility inhibition protein FinO [Klebsiella pneumoniae]|nr:conjugal transfer fertility inhibition protein FinO [Klebsiella pneumoniae]